MPEAAPPSLFWPIPVPPPANMPEAQAAWNALMPYLAQNQINVTRTAFRREHLLTPSDFATVPDGPFESMCEYHGLCLPSLRFHGDNRQTAYALIAFGAYILGGTNTEATISLTWIPRTSGDMHFDVWLGPDGDATQARPEIESSGIVTGGAPAGHWMTSNTRIPAPVATRGGAVLLTVSSHVPIDVDLIAAQVSFDPLRRLP